MLSQKVSKKYKKISPKVGSSHVICVVIWQSFNHLIRPKLQVARLPNKGVLGSDCKYFMRVGHIIPIWTNHIMCMVNLMQSSHHIHERTCILHWPNRWMINSSKCVEMRHHVIFKTNECTLVSHLITIVWSTEYSYK